MTVRLKSAQWEVFNSPSRFRTLAAGRRFGKTFLSQVELCRAAWEPGCVAWYVGPTYKQAKAVAWSGLKQMTKPYWAKKPNESELTITLVLGGVIGVRGADNYDNLRGLGLDFVVLDEYASMAPQAWTEVIRPMLADRQGRALFIGTPKGYNHFYDLFDAAQSNPDWETFRFTTEQGGIVTPEELQSAAREMDARVFEQEFRASFENLTSGRVYYAFERTKDVREVEYDPRHPLYWTLDFNVDPACSLLCQVIPPAIKTDAARLKTLGDPGHKLHVLDEIVLRDANTPQVCRAFHERTQQWVNALDDFQQMQVRIYGDATGERRQSSGSRSDWQLIREFFTRNQDVCSISEHIPNSNPPVRDRINSVNAMICNARGERRIVISPKCKQLIRDLEQVVWKVDANGNPTGDLDHSDPMRTHASDALGYLIWREFPVGPKNGLRQGVIC